MTLTLTRASIAAALAKASHGQRVELIDSVEQGLRLRSAGEGAQWSCLVRLTGGDRLRVPLGPWPIISVAEARAGARALRLQIDLGEFRSETSLTVEMLLKSYGVHELTHLRSGNSRERSLRILLKDLMRREVASLGRRDLSEALEKVALTAPVHANRMLAYVKAMFAWAVRRGRLEVNPAVSLGKLAREHSREHTPSLNELAGIWIAADTLGYPFGDAVQVLIATAARRSEVANLRVEELSVGLNEDEPCWVLPATRSKNDRALRSPLSNLAQRVIRNALERRPENTSLLTERRQYRAGRRPRRDWTPPPRWPATLGACGHGAFLTCGARSPRSRATPYISNRPSPIDVSITWVRRRDR